MKQEGDKEWVDEKKCHYTYSMCSYCCLYVICEYSALCLGYK
jgi:hypothetical protein